VTIDLSGVTFMDSTGIHLLVEAAAALGDRGCIIVHGAQGSAARVLEIMQFGSLKPNVHLIDCDVLAATG
jgi:anti-anti-sigma factor